MKRFQLTLRDLLWLVVVVGVACGWWVDARRARAQRAKDVALLASTKESLVDTEELLSSLGYTLIDRGTSYTTTADYWPARNAASAVLKDLLAGKQGAALLLPDADELREFKHADIATQEPNPCKPSDVRFEVALSGPDREARMILWMTKQPSGQWTVDGLSGLR